MKGNRIECDNISLTYSLSVLYVLVVFQKPHEKCNIMPLANKRQKQLLFESTIPLSKYLPYSIRLYKQ